MTKTEVVHFMEKIKAYYPGFTMEEYKMNEWYDRLKPYDLNDVYRKFDQHLNGEQKDKAPMLHYIIRYLKTPQEKARTQGKDYIIRCNLCGREMYLSIYEHKHFDRCCSIMYLLPILKKKGIEVEYEMLEQLDQKRFDAVYQEYMEVNENAKKYKSQISTEKTST